MNYLVTFTYDKTCCPFICTTSESTKNEILKEYEKTGFITSRDEVNKGEKYEVIQLIIAKIEFNSKEGE